MTKRSRRPAKPIKVTVVRRQATPEEWQKVLDVLLDLLDEQRSRRGAGPVTLEQPTPARSPAVRRRDA